MWRKCHFPLEFYFAIVQFIQQMLMVIITNTHSSWVRSKNKYELEKCENKKLLTRPWGNFSFDVKNSQHRIETHFECDSLNNIINLHLIKSQGLSSLPTFSLPEFCKPLYKNPLWKMLPFVGDVERKEESHSHLCNEKEDHKCRTL